MSTHVFDTMGTTVSIAFPDGLPARDRLDSVERVFELLDNRYSLYRADSALSRIARGDLQLTAAPAEVRDAYADSLVWRELTDGAFSPHRPDGVLDLSGTVKAMAMRDAGVALTAGGVTDWCLNAGGDVLTSGRVGSTEWIVGVVDPLDRGELLTSIALAGSRHACATSGTAERGAHIWGPPGAESPFRQVTVVADDILTADVLATAIVAGGESTLALATGRWSIDVLTVDVAGECRMTPGMRTAMSAMASTDQARELDFGRPESPLAR